MYRDDKIRSEMALQNLNDETLGELSGLTRQTVASLRKGEAKDPKLSTLISLAEALGKDLAWLTERKTETAEAA